MNLEEIRAKYPQYDDFSDGEFARQFHEKFYPEMPFEDFANRVGYVDTEAELKIQAAEAELRGIQESMKPTGRTEALLASMGRGMAQLGAGVSQISLGMDEKLTPEFIKNTVIHDVAKKRLKQYVSDVEKDAKAMGLIKEEFPVTNFIGETAGEMLLLPNITALPKSLVKKIAIGVAEGAGVAALQPTSEGESRAQNMVQGGVFGGMASAVGGKILKMINAKQGRMANKAAQNVQDISDKLGFDVALADTKKSAILNRVDMVLEMLPFIGSQGPRRRQMEGLQHAFAKLRNEYQKAFADFGDDAARVIKDGRFRELTARRTKAGKLFDEVRDIMGDAHVPTPSLNAAAKKMYRAELSLGDKGDKEVVKFLRRYINDSGLDFKGFQTVRSRMKRDIRKLELGTEESSRLAGLIDAIEDDAAKAVRAKGGARAKRVDDTARKYYREKVVPLKLSFFKNVDDPDKLDDVVRKYMSTTSGDNARQLYNALDEPGRAAMRFTIIDHALDKATEAGGDISPKVFANQLKNYTKISNVVFKPDERQFLKGLQKVMSKMDAATRHAHTPLTGMGATQIATGAVTGVGLMTDASTFGSGLASAYVLRSALSTDGGRRLIQAAANSNGKTLQEIIEGLTEIGVVAAGVEAGDE